MRTHAATSVANVTFLPNAHLPAYPRPGPGRRPKGVVNLCVYRRLVVRQHELDVKLSPVLEAVLRRMYPLSQVTDRTDIVRKIEDLAYAAHSALNAAAHLARKLEAQEPKA